MIYPKLLLKHAQARRAIAGYPLYDVPNKREEGTLDEARVQCGEFRLFGTRIHLDRLSFFQKWLRDWFGVRATLNGDGLLALNEWVNASMAAA